MANRVDRGDPLAVTVDPHRIEQLSVQPAEQRRQAVQRAQLVAQRLALGDAELLDDKVDARRLLGDLPSRGAAAARIARPPREKRKNRNSATSTTATGERRTR